MNSTTRACPLCDATMATLFLAAEAVATTGEQYKVVTCDSCGLRYTRPLPSEEELIPLYSQEYYGASKSRRLSWDSLRLLLHQYVLWQRRGTLGSRPPGRILDVGCGDGDFLASLKRRGWETYATDLSAAACKRAQERGIMTHQGDLVSANFPDHYFDVITLWHVLEHVPHPSEDLVEVRRILKDDGLLVVETPNSDSFTLRLCGARWFSFDVPRHLQHFTPVTLQALLRRTGFSIRRRRDFQLVDFVLVSISVMNRLGALGSPSGRHYFVTDYRSAAWGARLRFLAVGLLVTIYSFPYSVVIWLATHNCEAVTMTFQKRYSSDA